MAVLFVEIADFASVVAAMTPAKCLELLNLVFYEFDWLTTESGLLKVETVGSGGLGFSAGCLPARRHSLFGGFCVDVYPFSFLVFFIQCTWLSLEFPSLDLIRVHAWACLLSKCARG